MIHFLVSLQRSFFFEEYARNDLVSSASTNVIVGAVLCSNDMNPFFGFSVEQLTQTFVLGRMAIRSSGI